LPKIPIDRLPPPGSREAGDYLVERLSQVEARRKLLPFITAVPIEDDLSLDAFTRLYGQSKVARVPIAMWQIAIWMFEKEEIKEQFLRDRFQIKGTQA
jgi:hypothetical protein